MTKEEREADEYARLPEQQKITTEFMKLSDEDLKARHE